MKKIMFKDKYGLTQAVLDGRKTMTRRIIKYDGKIYNKAWKYHDYYPSFKDALLKYSLYKTVEVVAIAQSYKSAYEKGTLILEHNMFDGVFNKMFVKAELMPHHIRITNIRVERLQDISDEDCLRERIEGFYGNETNKCKLYNHPYGLDPQLTPRTAFARFINKAYGKGTWERNPYVFVYEFKLVD